MTQLEAVGLHLLFGYIVLAVLWWLDGDDLTVGAVAMSPILSALWPILLIAGLVVHVDKHEDRVLLRGRFHPDRLDGELGE